MKKNLIRSLLDLGSLASLSRMAESHPLQDPFRIRARYLGWKTASLLINEKGDLNEDRLAELLRVLEEGGYPVGQSEGDAWIFQHLRATLSELERSPALRKALKRCSLPLYSKEAEEVVRSTLWPDEVGALTHAHVRRAVLTALLTLLRQATGSCFATAPAILIQREDPVRLVRDLDAVLSTGELRRGSYAAPLHPGSGLADLQKKSGVGLSPGLRAAFYAAGVPAPQMLSESTSVKRLLEEGLLAHFGLTEEDLAKEAASLAPQFGVLWERMGGHYGGASPKVKQIRAWEKASARAKSAFLATADSLLLRSWEYTLASFSDVKVEFARWNLYVSLGLHPEASPPGIGAALLRMVQERLDQANGRMMQARQDYEWAVQAARTAERLLQQASNEAERSRLKAELVAEAHGVNSLAGNIEAERKLAQFLSQFYAQFLKAAAEQLQLSFQEVFDPALGEAKEELFEDGRAGFRLLYKSGRSAAASWERIEEESGFIRAIYKFFESIESQWAIEPFMQSCFTSIVTELLQYIRSDEFIGAAIERAKKNKTAKNALPWAYESGGTMQTLLQSYCEMPARLEEFSRKIASPLQLHAFLREAAAKASKERHLMLSPTHAFLFCPDQMGPPDALEKGLHFVKGLALTPLQIEFLIDRFAETLAPEARPLFYFALRQQRPPESLSELRLQLLSTKQAHLDRIDSFLYEALPVFSFEEASAALGRMGVFAPELQGDYFLSCDLMRMAKQNLAQEKGSYSSVDWDLQLAIAARDGGIVYPAPILFGDTNWSDWSFGIIRNIATAEAELWRLSRTGLSGLPMTEWKPIFRENSRWSIFL